MKNRTLGPYTVSAIGLGAMPVSMNRDNTYPARDDAIAMIHAALDAGVTLIDTADIYAPADAEMGHNEQIVRDALARLTEGRTTLVIAHRLATVRAAEKIVVMDAGRVAEVGTHDALVAAGGLYAKFHKLQLAAD